MRDAASSIEAVECPDRALADYAAALQLDPRSWEAYLDRGWVYRDQRKLDEALADFDHAIEYAPERPNPHIGRGSILEMRHDNDGALKEYDQAVAGGRTIGLAIRPAARC
jgi:tetratricopeptide (TPR) repeat protein